MLVTLLSLAALTAGAYALGRELFGRAPAVLGALFVGSSFAFLLYAVRAFVDVPFLALVVWAAALEVRAAAARPAADGAAGGRGAAAARGVGAGGGLLAVVPAGPRRARADRAGRARRRRAAGWALVDLAVTGDPLYSLHATNELADELGRERGIGAVPRSFVTFLAAVARPPVALAGVIGLVLARAPLRRRADGRADRAARRRAR